MGYNTRDEVWKFSLSGDAKPDDMSRWVPRLEGGPRYNGVAPYCPGWWYGLDAVDNTWKYHRTDSPDGPAGKALRDPDGWKTEAELNQRHLQEIADQGFAAIRWPTADNGPRTG